MGRDAAANAGDLGHGCSQVEAIGVQNGSGHFHTQPPASGALGTAASMQAIVCAAGDTTEASPASALVQAAGAAAPSSPQPLPCRGRRSMGDAACGHGGEVLLFISQEVLAFTGRKLVIAPLSAHVAPD